MIPEHLAVYPWYAPHQAYLVQTHGYARHAPPEGTVAQRASLYGANLTGANLTGANLSGANLTGAINITSAGPVGAERRIVYAVRHDAGVMVHAGCFWGPIADFRAAIEARYADGTGREQHRSAYLAAADYLAAWGAS